MHHYIDKHDIDTIVDALELLADEVGRNEAEDVGYRWRPYTKDGILNLIDHLQAEDEDE